MHRPCDVRVAPARQKEIRTKLLRFLDSKPGKQEITGRQKQIGSDFRHQRGSVGERDGISVHYLFHSRATVSLAVERPPHTQVGPRGRGQHGCGLAKLAARPILIRHAGLVHQPISRTRAAPGLRARSGWSGRVSCRHGGTDASLDAGWHQHKRPLPRLRRQHATRRVGSRLHVEFLLEHPSIARTRHRIGASCSGRFPGLRGCNCRGHCVGPRSASTADFSPLVEPGRA